MRTHTMLDKLIVNADFSFSCLLTDSLQSPAINLLSCYLRSLERNSSSLPMLFCHPLDKGLEHSVSSLASIIIVNMNSPNIGELVRNGLQEKSGGDVIFTNLSQLIFKYGLSQIAVMMRQLKESEACRKFIGLVHQDVITSEEDLDTLRFLFDACIDVKPAVNYPEYQAVAVSRNREGSGKVSFSEEVFIVTEGHELKTSPVLRLDSESSDNSTGSAHSGLTFNLSLSENEKQARNQVQLPYIKKESEKNRLLNRTAIASGKPLVSVSIDGQSSNSSQSEIQTNTSKIFYQYDEVDDFDEEDPDDDLDI